ncbi:MAG: hypothetical protein AAF790_01540 [Planctomycetota bacterium]
MPRRWTIGVAAVAGMLGLAGWPVLAEQGLAGQDKAEQGQAQPPGAGPGQNGVGDASPPF